MFTWLRALIGRRRRTGSDPAAAVERLGQVEAEQDRGRNKDQVLENPATHAALFRNTGG